MSAAALVALGAALGAALACVAALLASDASLQDFRRGGRALAGLVPPTSVGAAPERPALRTGAAPERVALQVPHWEGVLPDNIVDQQLPMVRNPHYGLHVIALGRNGSLFHKYQTGAANTSDPMAQVPMTEWLCLTPAVRKNTSGAILPLVFGNSPAVALNADGRIELFVGYQADSLDLWQMYQTDAKDPLAWSRPRAPYCDPSLPDCQACLAAAECKANFWSDGYTWTTSQQALWLNPDDQKLRLTWRNFDGHMYEKVQTRPSMSEHWSTEGLQYPIFE